MSTTPATPYGAEPPFHPPVPACEWCATSAFTWAGAPVHTDACPEFTNLWPITQPVTGETLVCGGCETPFEDADYGIKVPVNGDTHLRVMCCLSCAFLPA